ncbi:hypothetical protein DsansV1_C08g0083511 [Dioscorea sansibarensis]
MEFFSSSSSSSSSETECFTPNSILSEGKKPRKKKNANKQQRKKPIEDDPWPRRSKSGVMLEGYVDASDGSDTKSDGGDGPVVRTKSLTGEDLEELKGCLDLGFGFSYDGIPELCGTLPALELCYSLSQRFLDEHQHQQQNTGEPCSSPAPSTPLANWKISSPGDHPEDVKARLKYWAQAVACTVRLCS